MFSISAMGALSFSLFFSVLPSSSNYQLNNYNYGSGGGTSTSTNYQINATTGQTSNVQSTSTNFKARSGNQNSQQADVPPAPTFTNPANYYNKLHFIVNPSTNPSDTKFSIAISSDNFATVYYVQSDNTISLTRGAEDYQTYTAWGGASGQLVIGLQPGTTYKMKVNAMQGSFTETEFGPEATVATDVPSITFDLDVASTDTETSPPFTTGFGDLLPATVTTATNKVWVDIDTNAESGVKVYINSAQAGLRSNSKSFTISSATADLSPASTGYGAQGSSATQSSGGPLTISAPYNVAAQNVGILDTSLRQIFSTSSPVTGGRGSLLLMAKATTMTPASDDYQDTLTVVAAASF